MDFGGIRETWLALDQAVSIWVAAALAPVAIYLLISGLDDFAVDLLRLFRRSAPEVPADSAQARVAILIPMWQEAQVAPSMLHHNLAAVRYPDFTVFVGVYPNDPATAAAVRECAAEDSRIQICEVDHPGPTSKADCLNAIWRGLLREESVSRRRFDLVVLHDAEDLIHPESLSIFSAHSSEWGMIQLPVLPLATGPREWTHGIYCDDFAESQGFDLETRVRLGAFLPGCGVGTAFRRDALDALAGDGDPFDESLLTEDYETGLRLYRMGVRQLFVPLQLISGVPVATREYFPRRTAGAVKQRGRWVAGNALQCWHRHGWGGHPDRGFAARMVHVWFLWRDRKGLWGNPLSLFCNLLLLYGLFSASVGVAADTPWGLATALGGMPWARTLLSINMTLLLSRIAFRTVASKRVYGWRFASLVLPRMLWGNVVNGIATGRALWLWTAHRLAGRSLPWGKTAHRYPAPAGLAGFKRPFEEILLTEQLVTPQDFNWASEHRFDGESLADSLLRLRMLTEDQMYEVLSIQHGVPLARLEPGYAPGRIARAIPFELQERWQVMAYRVEPGRIYVAAPSPPSDELESAVRRWTRLEVRFRLIPPRRFEELKRSVEEAAGYNPENEVPRSLGDRSRGAAAGAD